MTSILDKLEINLCNTTVIRSNPVERVLKKNFNGAVMKIRKGVYPYG